MPKLIGRRADLRGDYTIQTVTEGLYWDFVGGTWTAASCQMLWTALSPRRRARAASCRDSRIAQLSRQLFIHGPGGFGRLVARQPVVSPAMRVRQ